MEVETIQGISPLTILCPCDRIRDQTVSCSTISKPVQSVSIFAGCMAVQVCLLLGSVECFNRPRTEFKAADMAFIVITGLALFGAAFTFIPLFCDPSSFEEDFERESGDSNNDAHMIYDSTQIHLASTIFLWGIGSFGQAAWLDSFCICASGASYIFITAWGMLHNLESTEDTGGCAAFGYLWNVMTVSVLLTLLCWDAPIKRTILSSQNIILGVQDFYQVVRVGLICLCIMTLFPFLIIGVVRQSLWEGCAMYSTLPITVACGKYIIYASEVEEKRRNSAMEETMEAVDMSYR